LYCGNTGGQKKRTMPKKRINPGGGGGGKVGLIRRMGTMVDPKTKRICGQAPAEKTRE